VYHVRGAIGEDAAVAIRHYCGECRGTEAEIRTTGFCSGGSALPPYVPSARPDVPARRPLTLPFGGAEDGPGACMRTCAGQRPPESLGLLIFSFHWRWAALVRVTWLPAVVRGWFWGHGRNRQARRRPAPNHHAPASPPSGSGPGCGQGRGALPSRPPGTQFDSTLLWGWRLRSNNIPTVVAGRLQHLRNRHRLGAKSAPTKVHLRRCQTHPVSSRSLHRSFGTAGTWLESSSHQAQERIGWCCSQVCYLSVRFGCGFGCLGHSWAALANSTCWLCLYRYPRSF